MGRGVRVLHGLDRSHASPAQRIECGAATFDRALQQVAVRQARHGVLAKRLGLAKVRGTLANFTLMNLAHIGHDTRERRRGDANTVFLQLRVDHADKGGIKARIFACFAVDFAAHRHGQVRIGQVRVLGHRRGGLERRTRLSRRRSLSIRRPWLGVAGRAGRTCCRLGSVNRRFVSGFGRRAVVHHNKSSSQIVK